MLYRTAGPREAGISKSKQSTPTTHRLPARVRDDAPKDGEPMPSALREEAPRRFGHDFGRVRVHPDFEAATAVRRHDAAAFTAAGGAVLGGALPIVHEVLSESGVPLDSASRAYFEPRFGRDFSKLRIHSGPRAAAAARAVDALAYTVGNEVVFGVDNYQPCTASGRAIIAHELTHVVQQSGGKARSNPVIGSLRVIGQDDALEREAELNSSRLIEGQPSIALSSGSLSVSRQPIKEHELPPLPFAAPLNAPALPEQLAPIVLILQQCKFYGVNDPSHVAYILASAKHESNLGRTMTEGSSGTQYENRHDLGNTQPGDGPRFKGRGFVQITGRRNYAKLSEILSVTREPVDLVANPEQATNPRIAAMILVFGMQTGIFSGKKLADFGRDPNYDFVGARAIVNDQDLAAHIAAIAKKFRSDPFVMRFLNAQTE